MRREKVTLNTQLRRDRATMEINIITGQRTIAGVVLSAEQLDGVIAGLADIRSKMTPEVPQTFPHGRPTHNHGATNYMFGIEPFSGTPTLSFRSSGFGWLSFPIPADEFEKMHHQWQEHKKHPTAPHSDKKQ